MTEALFNALNENYRKYEKKCNYRKTFQKLNISSSF